MIKSDFLSVRLTPKEQFYGLCYLAFDILFLPSLLNAIGPLLSIQLTNTHINLLRFSINLLAATLILHRFILSYFPVSGRKLLKIVVIAAAGFVLYWTLKMAVGYLVYLIQPNFSNKNDQAVVNMIDANYPLMFIATVIFVPISEECFFRGVLFRGFYDRSPAAAWVISLCFFSVVHIIGHTGSMTPFEMALSFVQYLPAGFCLTGSYYLSGSLLCPILIHIATNWAAMIILG